MGHTGWSGACSMGKGGGRADQPLLFVCKHVDTSPIVSFPKDVCKFDAFSLNGCFLLSYLTSLCLHIFNPTDLLIQIMSFLMRNLVQNP